MFTVELCYNIAPISADSLAPLQGSFFEPVLFKMRSFYIIQYSKKSLKKALIKKTHFENNRLKKTTLNLKKLILKR